MPFDFEALFSVSRATAARDSGSEGLAVELYCGTLTAGCAASDILIPLGLTASKFKRAPDYISIRALACLRGIAKGREWATLGLGHHSVSPTPSLDLFLLVFRIA